MKNHLNGKLRNSIRTNFQAYQKTIKSVKKVLDSPPGNSLKIIGLAMKTVKIDKNLMVNIKIKLKRTERKSAGEFA